MFESDRGVNVIELNYLPKVKSKGEVGVNISDDAIEGIVYLDVDSK